MIVLLAINLAILAFFFDLWTGQKVPAFRDILLFALPYKGFLAERIRTGTLPLWNPWLNLGTPFLAALQTGVFYPPSLLLLAGVPTGFGLFLSFHYLVAAIGMWLYVRGRGVSTAAAAVAAVTFTFGGYLLSMMNVTNHLQAGVWAPWVLFAWDRYRARPSRLLWTAFTLLLAVQILAGAPETVLMTLAILGADQLGHFASDPRRTAFATSTLALALAGAVAVTAVQILPTAEYIHESARRSSLPYKEVMTWSLQPVSLLQLLLPHGRALGPGDPPGSLCPMFENTQPWIISFYFGLPALCLSIVGAAFGRERRLWLSAAVLAVVFALGKHLPLLPFLFRICPALFGRFRFPEKFVFITHFSVAMLAAFGIDVLLKRDPRAVRLIWIAAATFAAVAVAIVSVWALCPELYLNAIVVLSGGFRGADTLASLAESVCFRAWRALGILAAIAVLLLVRHRGHVSDPTFACVLVTLTGLDLATVHYDLNLNVPWADLRSRQGIVDFDELRRDRMRIFHYQTDSASFPGEPPLPVRGLVNLSRVGWKTDSARTLFEQGWQASLFNVPMLENVGTLSGGDGITRASENVLSDALSLPTRPQAVTLLGTFSVRYLIGTDPLDVPGIRLVHPPGELPFFVYRIDHPLPRAYLATRWHRASSDLESVNGMISTWFEPGADAMVSGSDDESTTRCDAGGGSVSTLGEFDDRLEFETDSACRSLLVVNDSYFPGWNVTVDGRPTRIVRTNLLVRGVFVPPGKHQIRFFYRPWSFRLGMLVSTAALGCLVLFCVRRRR